MVLKVVKGDIALKFPQLEVKFKMEVKLQMKLVFMVMDLVKL